MCETVNVLFWGTRVGGGRGEEEKVESMFSRRYVLQDYGCLVAQLHMAEINIYNRPSLCLWLARWHIYSQFIKLPWFLKKNLATKLDLLLFRLNISRHFNLKKKGNKNSLSWKSDEKVLSLSNFCILTQTMKNILMF